MARLIPAAGTTARLERRTIVRGCLVVSAVIASAAAFGSTAQPVSGAGFLATAVDTDSSPGYYTSMQLDDAGNPVVSYQAALNDDLRILHCDDPTCSGGGESIETPVSTNDVGEGTSLQLDANGNPIVAYYDATAQRLRILRCDDPNCAPGGDTIATPDLTTKAGRYPSMQLDAAGNPVVAYRDDGDNASGVERPPGLRILHCSDPACQGTASIEVVDTAGSRGVLSSLRLDAAGNPVVAHHDVAGYAYDLVLLHCNDPNCAGGDESITTPDTAGQTGEDPSLVLDAAGNPIVSYRSGPSGSKRLNVLRCDDPDCAPGGDTIEQPDPDPGTGVYSSIQLDSAGLPVVSYYADFGSAGGQNFVFFDLRVMRCNDVACAGADEEIITVDSFGQVGEYTSFQLDADDNPIVSYRSGAQQALKIAVFGEFPAPLPACVVGFWRGEGDATATVGPDLTGTASFAPGFAGQSFDLGSGDDLQVGGGFPTLTDEVSVDMWIRPDPTGRTQTLMSRWDFPSTDDGARTFVLRLSPFGRLEWSVDDVSSRRPALTSATAPGVFDGNFHHVAATWNRSELAVFYDGVELVRTPAIRGALNPAAGIEFRLGSEGAGAPRFPFVGLIDDPAVYSCAIDPAEIEAIYLAGPDGKA